MATTDTGEKIGPPADALRLSWADVFEMTESLAGQIEGHCRETGEAFDRLVVFPRGGYFMAGILSQMFGFDATTILHAGLTSYEPGQRESSGDFRYGQMPTAKEMEGLRLLFVDEVWESGETQERVRRIAQAAGAESVRSGVLHYKPGLNVSDAEPNWYVQATDCWVEYPWEHYEAESGLSVVRRRAEELVAD